MQAPQRKRGVANKGYWPLTSSEERLTDYEQSRCFGRACELSHQLIGSQFVLLSLH